MPEGESLERLFLDHLSLVDQVVRIVARRRRFSADEAEEFGATVRMSMVEDDYRILRGYRGEASLRAYLITVIGRLALDFVVARTGKWRPSARALRLGERAVRLEREIVRDGRAPAEAVEIVAAADPQATKAELQTLLGELPIRPRPRRVPLDERVIEELAAPDSAADAMEHEARGRDAAWIERTLRAAMAALPAEDRLLLKLRYESGLPVPAIAPILGRPAKRLYKRTEWVLERLRRDLASAGISPDGLERLEATARLVSLWLGGEEAGMRPSLRVEGSAESPSGRTALGEER